MRFCVLTSMAVLLLYHSGSGQPIPSMWKQVVVLLGKETLQGIVPHGTGFLMYDYARGDSSMILVTNKHIFGSHEKLYVRFNLSDSVERNQNVARAMEIPLRARGPNSKALWIGHPDSCVDVAVIRIKNPAIVEKLPLALETVGVSTVKKKASLAEGENIVYLGFPFGIGASTRDTPVLRHGIVSLLDGSDCRGEVLLEAQALPGNSGSPVFQVTVLTPDTKLRDMKPPMLIGIMSYHQAEYETCLTASGDTVNVPIHTGLSYMFTVDMVYETIDALNRAVDHPQGR